MIELTPTSKSSFLAGMGLSCVGWLTASHLDAIADLFNLSKWVSRKKLFDWIGHNGILTFLFTEFVNYGGHGIDNPNTVTFAAGATVINAIAITCVVIRTRLGNRLGLKAGA
jgi:hypothetical protein